MKAIFKIVASFAFAVASASCSRDLSEPFSEGGRDASAGKVTLLLNVETLGTRSGETATTMNDLKRPFEKPKYLRVVIINTDFRADVKEDGDSGGSGRANTPWNVEVNYRISEDMALAGDVMDAARKQLKFPNIKADRKKRVYILINCEDIPFRLADGTTCTLNDGDALEKLFGAGKTHPEPLDPTAEHPYQTGRLPIDDCTYRFEDTKKTGTKGYAGLPYVGVYEVDVPSTSYVLEHYEALDPDATFIEPQFPVGPLYLVRAANRIRFEFVNDTSHADGQTEATVDPIDIEVTGWTLSSTADRAYLMPRLDMRTSNGNGWDKDGWANGWKKGQQQALSVPGTYEAGKDKDGNLKEVSADDYYGGAWMLWLKQEAEATQNTADSYNGMGPNAEYEWLTGYEVPKDVTYNELKHEYSSAITVNRNTTVQVPEDDDKNGVYEDAVYFAESRYLPDGSGNGQRYSLSVRVRQINTGREEEVKTYTCEELPNSLSLFRNTDLLVRVYFRKLRTDGLEMSVDVVPYGVCELEPKFGLDE